MKAAARTALVPALVLCAALAAAPEGAWAGDPPVMPFPGAAADGGEKAAPASLGATEASPVAPARPAAAGEETASPADSPAEPETAAGPTVIGGPAGSGAPGDLGLEPKADKPAGGSRLLRVLAGTAKASASPGDEAAGAGSRSGPRVSGRSVFAAGGCPRALLRRLLAGAAGEADALSALGIEREILTLCRERQEILVGLFEAEAALRELSAPPSAPTAAAAAKTAVAPAPPAPARRIVPAVRPAAPSPLRAVLAAAENADEADPRAGEPKAARYAWFSIVGSAGALRAGVTDGSGVWFVREGDVLPGGARIAAIAARPPAVRIAGSGETLVPESGEAVPLPYRAWPGDVP